MPGLSPHPFGLEGHHYIRAGEIMNIALTHELFNAILSIQIELFSCSPTCSISC